jgi:MATE family multidrug resistance protein
MGSGKSLHVDTSVKGILLLTIPISLSKLVPELNYLFNAVFLSRLGVKELGLAGLIGVYYLIFSAIGYGLNNALLAIMSRRAGEDNRDAIFMTLWHGLVIGTVLALATIFFTHFWIEGLLLATGVEKEGASMAADFLQIRMWGLLFLYAFQMQNAYLVSLQNSRYLIIGAIVAAVSNVFFDYVFIFGKYNFPELGFNGAAYASVISEFLGMVSVFFAIYFSGISKKYRITLHFSIHWKTIRLVLKQAWPLMGQYAISTWAWWVFFILVNRNYTATEQGISQAMRNLFGLSGVFTWAFGSATNTIISNVIGQGKINQIKSILLKICLISGIGLLFFILVINIWPKVFLQFYGLGEFFIQEAIGPLRVVTIAMLILGVGVIMLNAVIATGKTIVVFWIEFAGITSYLLYIFFVIEIWKGSHLMAWMSEWVYWAVMFVFSFLYLWKGNWRKNLTYQ